MLDAHQEATAQKTGAVTNYLAYAIIEKSTPIIVNGAVFHNFLLLQKKGTELLNKLPYPTIQKLCTALYESKKETTEQTKDSITYMQSIRRAWYNQLPEKTNSINETLINDAAQSFFSLIPQTSVTTEINEAEYQIIPQLNYFLDQLQSEFQTFFKSYKTTDVAQLNRLIKKYNELLTLHLKELEAIKKILFKNLQLIITAHNLLTEYVFEYTYRFAHFKKDLWKIFFQKETDLYLLVPENISQQNLQIKNLHEPSWNKHQDIFKMIAQDAIESQGVYALYQRTLTNPLQLLDQFFILEDQKYKEPLDVFMIGHGAPQEKTEIYFKQQTYQQQRIKATLQFLSSLTTLCEERLMEITEQPVDEIIHNITNFHFIKPDQYKSMTYDLNKKFIDQAHAKNQNPLCPEPIDVENFLQKSFHQLQKTDLEYSFFWLFINNLSTLYQKASDALTTTKHTVPKENTDLIPESAHLAGLTVNQLSDFIESSIETKRLKNIYFLTCFGGGSNRRIFEKIAKQLNIDPEFQVNLAVGALTDAAVPSLIPTLAMFTIDDQAHISFTPSLSFKTFFAEKLSINGLQAITVGQKYDPTSSVNEYFHGVADLPWKYNQTTEQLELVNLHDKLLDLTKKKLKTWAEEKKEALEITKEKVIMLHEPTIELSLTLNPQDTLLPLICSAKTDVNATHRIKELILPQNTLHDLLRFSIGHLRQTKEYDLTIETLTCAGITEKQKDLLVLKNVHISSRIQETIQTTQKPENPEEQELITWSISIGSLPLDAPTSQTELYCKDYFNQKKERIFTQFFARQ